MSTTAPLSLIGSSRWALAANAMTIARFIGGPIVAYLILQQNPWWLTFALGWVLGATDFFDGRLARRAEPTRLGAFLDPLADKIVVLLAGSAMVVIGRWGWVPMALMTVREVAITVYRSYWAKRGLAIPARPAGKYKAVVQGAALLAAAFPPLEPHPIVADVLLWVAVAFTLYTGVLYAVDGENALRTTGRR